jgi:hypothetical protein
VTEPVTESRLPTVVRGRNSLGQSQCARSLRTIPATTSTAASMTRTIVVMLTIGLSKDRALQNVCLGAYALRW